MKCTKIMCWKSFGENHATVKRSECATEYLPIRLLNNFAGTCSNLRNHSNFSKVTQNLNSKISHFTIDASKTIYSLWLEFLRLFYLTICLNRVLPLWNNDCVYKWIIANYDEDWIVKSSFNTNGSIISIKLWMKSLIRVQFLILIRGMKYSFQPQHFYQVSLYRNWDHWIVYIFEFCDSNY